MLVVARACRQFRYEVDQKKLIVKPPIVATSVQTVSAKTHDALQTRHHVQIALTARTPEESIKFPGHEKSRHVRYRTLLV